MDKPKRGVDGEEHEHDRAEEGGDTGGSAALRGKEQHEDDDRRGQDVGREFGVDLLQPFERRQDRNRRRDHGVAREEAEPATPSRKASVVLCPSARCASAIKRQDAALALVVRLHQEQHIFSGDDDQERPDDERDDADHLRGAERGAFELAKRGLQRVEGARADIAEHDADRAERQDPETVARMASRLAIECRGRDGFLRDGLGHAKWDPRVVGCGRTRRTAASILLHRSGWKR